jgi:hypothetical protein
MNILDILMKMVMMCGMMFVMIMDVIKDVSKIMNGFRQRYHLKKWLRLRKDAAEMVSLQKDVRDDFPINTICANKNRNS